MNGPTKTGWRSEAASAVGAESVLIGGSDQAVEVSDDPGLRAWDQSQLRFDANVSILFGDRPVLERPALAAAAGFDEIEMWWPFDKGVPSSGEADRLVASIADQGLSLIC